MAREATVDGPVSVSERNRQKARDARDKSKQEQQAWETLVRKCERYAADNPERYQRKVLHMARSYKWITLSVLLTLLLTSLAAAYGLYVWDAHVVKKTICGLALLGLVVSQLGFLRRFMLTAPEFDGYVLQPDEAVELQDLVRDVAQTLKAPLPDEIQITSELNASACEYHKSLLQGGGTERVLTIGIWLLASVTRNEMRSVIAHEFGHFISAHNITSRRVGRVLNAIIDIRDDLNAEEALVAPLIVPLLERAYFRLSAYSFALRRADEYEADTIAARVAGRATMADTLVRINAAESEVEDYFADLRDTIVRTKELPGDAISNLCAKLPHAVEGDNAVKAVRRALARETEPTDSHPSCVARISAQGIEPRVPLPVREPALRLLGPLAKDLLDTFDVEYREATEDHWRDVLDHVDERRDTLKTLDRLAASSTLALGQAVNRAYLAYCTETQDTARQRYDDLMTMHAEQARAHYAMAQFLYYSGDAGCVEHFENCITLDETSMGTCAEYLCDHFITAGDLEAAELWRKRGEEFAEHEDELRHKSSWLTPQSPISVEDADRKLNATLMPMLEPISLLREAFVVRNDEAEWFGGPTVWLVVRDTTMGGHVSSDEIYADILEAVWENDASLLDRNEVRFWLIEQGEEPLLDHLRTLPGAQMFNKDADAAASVAAPVAAAVA